MFKVGVRFSITFIFHIVIVTLKKLFDDVCAKKFKHNII